MAVAPRPPTRSRTTRRRSTRWRGASDEPVSTSAIAERLGVSPASASAMVKRLAALGLGRARALPRRGADAAAGERVALEVIRHHRLLELYLAEALGHAVGPRARRGRGARARDLAGAVRADRARSSATRPTTRTATRSRPPTARSRSARRARWPTSSRASAARSPASRTPTRRCCATCPSAASPRARRSRSWGASRSTARCTVRIGRREHALGSGPRAGDAGRVACRFARGPRRRLPGASSTRCRPTGRRSSSTCGSTRRTATSRSRPGSRRSTRCRTRSTTGTSACGWPTASATPRRRRPCAARSRCSTARASTGELARPRGALRPRRGHADVGPPRVGAPGVPPPPRAVGRADRGPGQARLPRPAVRLEGRGRAAGGRPRDRRTMEPTSRWST